MADRLTEKQRCLEMARADDESRAVEVEAAALRNAGNDVLTLEVRTQGGVG